MAMTQSLLHFCFNSQVGMKVVKEEMMDKIGWLTFTFYGSRFLISYDVGVFAILGFSMVDVRIE